MVRSSTSSAVTCVLTDYISCLFIWCPFGLGSGFVYLAHADPNLEAEEG